METPHRTGGSAADPTPLTESDASLLVRLIDELTTAARQGESPDVEALAGEHPRLADELRSLWATIWFTESLARAENPELPSGDRTVLVPSTNPSTDPPASLQGSVIFGDYQLLEELGQGGMGVVFRARELGRGRIVALKRLLRGAESKAQDVERFRVEAMAAAHLAHPHIVPVFQAGEHEGQPFFTMQYIAGTTLARKLAEGPMPGLDAARLLVPVCRAIHSAHDRGVLHRDLKPSNILIDTEGHSYVSDFGLAKRLDLPADASLTPSGAIVGTPGYMPPEQARAARGRGPLGPACDVYSLGAILYHMLTGRPPFQAASPVETLMLMLEQDPVPPRVLNPRVSADLEMITLRCLQKQPILRYGSAAALADDLEAFLRDEPVSARSTSLPRPGGPVAGRDSPCRRARELGPALDLP